MLAKKKDIAFLGDRNSSWRGRKRPLFVRRRIVAKQDLIDFGRAETGNLDRRLFDVRRVDIERFCRDLEDRKSHSPTRRSALGKRPTPACLFSGHG